VKLPRSSGILLHPTSLPGRYGIGDLGIEALQFASFLKRAGIKIWQLLPPNPTGYGDSPYQCFSAFAGNPLLISLDDMVEQCLLTNEDLEPVPAFPGDDVRFSEVIRYKLPLLRKAARRFFNFAQDKARAEFERFCEQQASWLNDFALFMACKDAHDLVAWTKWEPELVRREPAALARWSAKLADDIEVHKFWQFIFYRQWHGLKAYCTERGIRIMGDVPIYVAHDSADVWSNPELFHLDENGEPTLISGVPPDYYSANGQLWGNPIYRWDVLEQSRYQWWIERLRGALDLFDMVRLDHFRGFEAYWEIPAGESTAINGRWVKGPGAKLFSALEKALGPLPIVAENLGVITPEVEALRHQFDYPGMAILEFAFGIDAQAPSFRPHNYIHQQVAYTGGHDNDTINGWWNSGAGDSIRTEDDVIREHNLAKEYLQFDENDEVNWVFIRTVMASVADTAIVPLQDILGCGSEARMNLPGRLGGNWKWRFRPGVLTSNTEERLRKMTLLYDR
jgi:4-alpha-glucanotransferase